MKIEKRGTVTPEEAAAAQSAPAAEGKHKPVLLYLVILFAIAIVLILYSFAMKQHSDAQTIRDLQSQVETLQQLKDVEQQYKDAAKENAALHQQIDDMEQQAAEASKVQQAQSLVWQLEQLYLSGENDACREVLKALKKDELYRSLPTESQYGEGEGAKTYESPYAAFDRIDRALNGENSAG